MFFVSYIVSELRRRSGRTMLTALGLGVGVGLVVTVSALSTGLDRAQDEVLEPLTGVGTDMSVTRPLEIEGSDGDVAPGQGLSDAEREQLREENGASRLDLEDVGEPGEQFTETNFLATSQLSFPDDEVAEIAGIDGVQDAAGSLTLHAMTVSGTVPEGGFQGGLRGGGGGGGGHGQDLEFTSMSVAGVDETKPDLAPASPGDVTEGRYLSANDEREAVLNDSYAQRSGIEVGDAIDLKGREYTVVGLVQSPLGGAASDVYIKLGQLQKLSNREGRVNTVQVRAESGDVVGQVERQIPGVLDSASVTTAADLADRIGGSLVDAKDLANRLGTALTVVALAAAFLIASLLTLSSVTKRIRELGTLKAIGWPQRLVVRQVTGESLAQGALGGVLGALMGIGGAALINALGPTLTASVAEQASSSAGASPAGGRFGFGATQTVTSGSTEIPLEAPIDVALILLAVSLALLGGLIAGSAGGLRAARLRPADALRHID